MPATSTHIAFRTGIGLSRYWPPCPGYAPHVVSVRQASALPAASFRFHLAMNTLAVWLTLAPVGCVENFHLQVSAPCRAHQKKAERFVQPLSLFVSGADGTRTRDLRRDRPAF